MEIIKTYDEKTKSYEQTLIETNLKELIRKYQTYFGGKEIANIIFEYASMKIKMMSSGYITFCEKDSYHYDLEENDWRGIIKRKVINDCGIVLRKEIYDSSFFCFIDDQFFFNIWCRKQILKENEYELILDMVKKSKSYHQNKTYAFNTKKYHIDLNLKISDHLINDVTRVMFDTHINDCYGIYNNYPLNKNKLIK